MGYGLPGAACDDVNPNTANDTWSANCVCEGTCLGGSDGMPCSDGIPWTNGDVWMGCFCVGWPNYITGQVFLDVDMDGVFGAGDHPIYQRSVQASPSAFYGCTSWTGNYGIRVASGTYGITVSPGLYDTQDTFDPAVDVTGIGQTSSGHDIAMAPSIIQVDLAAFMTGGLTKPGFSTVVYPVGKNVGTIPVDGTLSLSFDPQQSVVGSSAGATIVGNTLTWEMETLLLGQAEHKWVILYTPPTVVAGTIVEYTTTVQGMSDGVPLNDVLIQKLGRGGLF